MPPQLLQLAVFGLEQLITQAPKLYADIAALFSKGQPTADDWQALRDKIGAKGYFDYVPQSDLPRDNT